MISSGRKHYLREWMWCSPSWNRTTLWYTFTLWWGTFQNSGGFVIEMENHLQSKHLDTMTLGDNWKRFHVDKWIVVFLYEIVPWLPNVRLQKSIFRVKLYCCFLIVVVILKKEMDITLFCFILKYFALF